MFSNKKNKENLPSSFDQTALQIAYQHGPTQLQQIKISYKWSDPSLKIRTPILNCQWFNKTQEAMELIEGVNQDKYQPSVLDVGTIIYIQSVPESKEMEYIGMPIVKYIGPLKLSEETEEEVNQLYQAQKSTFFTQIKEINLKKFKGSKEDNENCGLKDPLLKIIQDKLIIMAKTAETEKTETILEISITKLYPQINLSRKNPKQLTIIFPKDQHATLLFKSRIRDVLYLLINKIKQTAPQYVPESQQQPQEEQTEVKSQHQIAVNKVSSEENFKKAEENLPLSPQTQVLFKQQTELQSQQKQETQTIQLKKSMKEIPNMQEQLRALKKTKQSLQTQNIALKMAQQKSQKMFTQIKEQKIKAEQQACYMKNECKVLHEQLETEKTHRINIESKMQTLQKKLHLSISPEEAENHYGSLKQLTFQQLLDQLLKREQEIKQSKYKSSYQMQHIETLENEVRQLNEKIENNQGHTKKLEKKVQSLVESKQMLSQQISSQHTHSHQLGSYQFAISKLKGQIDIIKQQRQKQNDLKNKNIDALKIQIKELIDQNTYLRSKEKGSKGELKHEIIQMKKLVNRFAQSIAEKDMQIQQMKNTNKELNKELQLLKTDPKK